jgi:hypothetical protein
MSFWPAASTRPSSNVIRKTLVSILASAASGDSSLGVPFRGVAVLFLGGGVTATGSDSSRARFPWPSAGAIVMGLLPVPFDKLAGGSVEAVWEVEVLGG